MTATAHRCGACGWSAGHVIGCPNSRAELIYADKLRAADTARLHAALEAARRVAWCCSANVAGIAYAERKQAMAELRGALHALDGNDYQARKYPR